MLYLRQSTASQNVLIGPFLDDTDFVAEETGLTIANTDIRLSKAGGNTAAKNSGGGTHDELGFYQITLDATDTNTVGTLQLYVSVAGALPVWHEYQVVEENVYDMLFAASADLGTTVDAILTDTAEIGAAGAGLTEAGGTGDQLTAVPWNAAWDAEVQSEATDALNAYDPPTRAELTSDISGLNDPTAAAIADAVWDEAKAGHVGAGSFGEEVQAHALSSEISALNDLSAADVNAEVDTALADYDPPTNAELTAGLGGLNDPTAAAIADAVWDEAQSGHVGAGTFGEMATEMASVLADTNELQTDLADGGRLDLLIDAILEDTGTTVPGLIAALNDLSAAEVNAQVLDVLNVDTFTELTSLPDLSSGATIKEVLMVLGMALLHKIDVTTTAKELHQADGTVLGTKTISNDGTTYSETKIA